MKTKNNQKHEPSNQLYLMVPMHILNIDGIALPQKLLLAHFYSFGKKGCSQSNAALAKIFMTTQRSITDWICRLKKAKTIIVKSPKGYFRIIWVKSHPEVAEIIKTQFLRQNPCFPLQNCQLTSQNAGSDFAESGNVT